MIPATDKGHMKRQKQGIRSTIEKTMTALSTIETTRDINPPMEKETQKREPQTGFWILPLTDTTHQPKTNTPADKYKRMNETNKQYAHNAYAMTSKSSLVQYLQQAAFSPPKANLLKAVHNNQFVTWPGLTVKALKTFLPDSSPA